MLCLLGKQFRMEALMVGPRGWEPSSENDPKTIQCLPHKDVQRSVYNREKLPLTRVPKEAFGIDVS